MTSRQAATRIPLLWLLVPLMGGLVGAHSFPTGSPIAWLAAAGVLYCGAFIAKSSTPWIWQSIIVVASVCLGYGYHLHLDAQNQARLDYPPRHAALTIEIERVFSKNAQKANGIARLVNPPDHLQDLDGVKLYFSLYNDAPQVSIAPTSQIKALAVLERASPEGRANGFQSYLKNIGTWGSFTRGPILEEVSPATSRHTFLSNARDWIQNRLLHGIDPSQSYAATYVAMTLGLRSALSPEQKDVFLKSGTMHLFAISGLHIGIIAACIHALLQLTRLPLHWLAIVSLVLIALFVAITGGAASAWRALLMIACYYLCQASRLQSAPLNALALSALICLIIDPRQLFQAGFQMSYGTVSAILLYGVPLANRANNAWQPFSQLPKATWNSFHHTTAIVSRYTINLFCIGLSTSLVSGFFSIAYFNTLPVVGILINFALLPIASLAIVAGFCSLLASLLFLTPLAIVFNNAAALLLSGIERSLAQLTAERFTYLQSESANTTLLLSVTCTVVAALAWGYSSKWPVKLRYLWLPPIATNFLAIFMVL